MKERKKQLPSLRVRRMEPYCASRLRIFFTNTLLPCRYSACSPQGHCWSGMGSCNMRIQRGSIITDVLQADGGVVVGDTFFQCGQGLHIPDEWDLLRFCRSACRAIMSPLYGPCLQHISASGF